MMAFFSETGVLEGSGEEGGGDLRYSSTGSENIEDDDGGDEGKDTGRRWWDSEGVVLVSESWNVLDTSRIIPLAGRCGGRWCEDGVGAAAFSGILVHKVFAIPEQEKKHAEARIAVGRLRRRPLRMP